MISASIISPHGDGGSEAFVADADAPEALAKWLISHGFMDSGESIRAVSPAGEGNMNLTLRIQSSTRNFILKQSYPWVAKYPQIKAPVHRLALEAEFYKCIASDAKLASGMPRVLGFDAQAHILLLEDLGSGGDLSDLYSGASISVAELETLAAWLGRLHTQSTKHPAKFMGDFSNRAMRALNHEHIFELPLNPDNGLDLDAITPGLAALARKLQDDKVYVELVRKLGEEKYLSDGAALLHGDFFPGSWFRGENRLCVIDAEFAFSGFVEFDVGVALGHLSLAELPQDCIEAFLAAYSEAVDGKFEARLTRQIAGVEMMRRLIGVAQLPLEASLQKKEEWLDQSRHWVLA